jgi:hypothetical protein
MSDKLYPKSYGAWAGNLQGDAPDYTRCCARVWSSERFSRAHQCQRKRGHGPDGAYCKQHDPAALEARKKATEARYNERFNEERYQWHGREFFNALVKIAEGHNDPRGLAREIIDAFKAGEAGRSEGR